MTVAELKAAEPSELGAAVADFRRWLYLPNELPLLAVLGTVAANRLPGDPVWIVLVAPAGWAKSELLRALGQLPDVYPTSTLTEAALLSGTPRKDREERAKGGLLREIGEFGIIVCKDLTSVLNMNRDARAQALAALREIYDGAWTRHVGTGGGLTLGWSGKVGLIAGCTPTIDRHHAVMGAMGERFVLMRLPDVDSEEQARRALAHAGREHEMRASLATAVMRLFREQEPGDPRPLEPAERERLVALATLVVRCRSAVERDAYSREVELIPGPEAPTRLVIVLERLLAGLDVIGVERERAWDVVTRVALDSMPALRRSVIEALLEAEEEQLGTPRIAQLVRHPEQTTRRTLEDLQGHGVVRMVERGQGKRPSTWILTPWTWEHYSAVRVPEMSGAVRNGRVPEMQEGTLSFTSPNVLGGFSGRQAREASRTAADPVIEGEEP